MLKTLILIIFCSMAIVVQATAQDKSLTTKEPPTPPVSKKANQRPADAAPAEPFQNASVEKMKTQCVKLETAAGEIEMEMYPESAPETVRSFLNLAATGFFDTTTFSRVVPGFVIQGGNITTREKVTQ